MRPLRTCLGPRWPGSLALALAAGSCLPCVACRGGAAAPGPEPPAPEQEPHAAEVAREAPVTDPGSAAQPSRAVGETPSAAESNGAAPVPLAGGSDSSPLPASGGVETSPTPPRPDAPPITPRWAFEPWVWEDNTNTRASTEALVNGYRDRQIPVGAVIIDSPWETAYNSLLWDTQRYPNPQDMIAGLHLQGVKVLLWIVAFVDGDAAAYQMVKQQGYAVNDGADATWWKGTGVHIDLTNPAAASWWHEGLGALLADGVDGWKLDRGADYIGDPVRTAQGSLSVTDFKRRVSADFFDYTTASYPNAIVLVRPYNRAQGGVGSDPSKCSVGWVGDHDGSFTGIATQQDDIYASAQMGYGAPGVEVGGYLGNAPSKNSLIRYAEFAATTPLMENGGSNGGQREHLPWSWDTQTVDVYRYFATLHSELASYAFSYGVEAHLTGTSILRGTDAALGQHRLGEELFVSALTSDVTSKQVVFPAGARWIDYWNEDVVYAGGSSALYPVPLDRYPLFIRAGAVLPLDVRNAVAGHGDESSAGKVTLLVYPAGASSFVFHRPLGEGTAYSDVAVDVDAAAGTLRVSGGEVASYRLRIKSLRAVTALTGADSWSYDAASKVVIADKQGAAFTISISGLQGY